MQRWLKAVLLLPLLAGGCVTHEVWTNGQLDTSNEPAGNPNLRLFDAQPRKDLLVVYDEYSERHYAIHTRAYFLYQNQERINQNHAPYFVHTNLMSRFPSVPVFCDPKICGTNQAQTLYAITTKNSESFTLYSSGQKLDSYLLPTYNDGFGKYERAALTPLAVTADLTIVGGVLAILYGYGLGDLAILSVSIKGRMRTSPDSRRADKS